MDYRPCSDLSECVCVGVCEVEGGGVGRKDERQPCTVISEVLRLKMTQRQGGLQLCAACKPDCRLPPHSLSILSLPCGEFKGFLYCGVDPKGRAADATSAAGSID